MSQATTASAKGQNVSPRNHPPNGNISHVFSTRLLRAPALSNQLFLVRVVRPTTTTMTVSPIFGPRLQLGEPENEMMLLLFLSI